MQVSNQLRDPKINKSNIIQEKKRHTVKIQLVVSLTGLVISSVICCKGSVYDFKLLKDSKLPLHPNIAKALDSRYQGIAKIYQNCEIPIKNHKKLQKFEIKMINSKSMIFIF